MLVSTDKDGNRLTEIPAAMVDAFNDELRPLWAIRQAKIDEAMRLHNRMAEEAAQEYAVAHRALVAKYERPRLHGQGESNVPSPNMGIFLYTVN